MTKTYTVDITDPAFVKWAKRHDLEPSLMSPLLTIHEDGTITADPYAFTRGGDWRTIPGRPTVALRRPITITPTRPIPPSLLTDALPPPPTRRVGTTARPPTGGRSTIDYGTLYGGS